MNIDDLMDYILQPQPEGKKNKKKQKKRKGAGEEAEEEAKVSKAGDKAQPSSNIAATS